jgi:diguanylate cyclase (GGDEF)-like protein
MDLDRFKEVNDTFGHHYGDELLRQIGPRLRTRLRNSDTIARLGGDEFAILLPNVGTLAAATAVADAVQLALEKPFHVEGVDLDVEASIGVVVSGEHGDDASSLLQHADTAMYVAKGRDLGVFAYESDTDTHSPGRLALLGELRSAIENEELFLHFQPKLGIGTGEVIGVEALVRWDHPTRGIVYPDDFVPLAEHTGLIGPLTRFVLITALTQAKSWSDQGFPLQVAVNLSARSLLDEHLPREVAELLAAHEVPAGLLKLEVTESAIMADPARASRLLRELADLGVDISIDDFGVGYTSLGQLKTLPITELKIDKSFVMTMNEDSSDALIVQSVIDLGHNLGLTIVAEGVESAEALDQLTAYGCDDAQGYHFCRPVAGPAFDDWLADYRDGIRLQRLGLAELGTTPN